MDENMNTGNYDKKTFHIIIYGCQMNYSDSARIRAVLQNCGRLHVENEADADVVIMDTCSVRQKSEDKIRGKLRELRPDQKIRLTGCMIQHNLNLKKLRTKKNKKLTLGNFVGTVQTKEPTIIGFEPLGLSAKLREIAKSLAFRVSDESEDLLYINHAFDPLYAQMHKAFPNVELFFRINDLWFLPYVMRKLWYEVDPDIDVVNEYTGIIPQNANMLFKENTKTAYVPISTGCSQFCAYCIVPYARGLEKNRPVDEILAEVEAQVAGGASEIVLLWQIVNKHPDFDEIVRKTCDTPGVVWVRYTSPYPTFYSDDLLELHASRENLCPHIHMPLQSWSDSVLKKMFRGYTAQEFKTFVDKIRALPRKISITSDVIVGFCTETEEDFLETIEMVKYAQFDLIYIGIYSPRPWTIAHRKFEDDVPAAVKKERWHRLNEVLKEVSAANNQQDIWTTRMVMVREVTDDKIAGYSEHTKQVIVEKSEPDSHKEIIPWQYITVRIDSVKSFTLYGEMVE